MYVCMLHEITLKNTHISVWACVRNYIIYASRSNRDIYLNTTYGQFRLYEAWQRFNVKVINKIYKYNKIGLYVINRTDCYVYIPNQYAF